jgi:hypothetical protein
MKCNKKDTNDLIKVGDIRHNVSKVPGNLFIGKCFEGLFKLNLRAILNFRRIK